MKLKLRWPRFSLKFSMRFLLMAMLVAGALLGLLGRELVRLRNMANERRAVISRLEAKGALIGLKKGLNRSYAEPLLEWMEGKPFPDIEGINLAKGAFDKADLEDVAKIETLKELVIFKSIAGANSWCAPLAKCQGLELILIDDDKFSAKGAKLLARTKSQLKQLVMFGFPVDDEFLRLAAEQPVLESIAIQGEGVSGEGIAELLNTTELTTITVRGGSNLGEGFAQLKDHPHLVTLHLQDYEWTPEDLASLQHLNTVTSLGVSSSKPLPKGILRAAAAMPKLRSLGLYGDFDPEEPVGSLKFPCLENFVTEGRFYRLDGLHAQLANCQKLQTIATLNTEVSESELEAMKELYRLYKFSIGKSPSREAIAEFQKYHPYCTYVDAELGEFPQRVPQKRSKVTKQGTLAAAGGGS